MANFDRRIRYVVVNPKRVRAEWGGRWAALAEYDMDRTAQRSVRAADSRLLRRINMPRIPADQLRKISGQATAVCAGAAPRPATACGRSRRSGSLRRSLRRRPTGTGRRRDARRAFVAGAGLGAHAAVAVPTSGPVDVAGKFHRRAPAGGGPHVGVGHWVVHIAGQGEGLVS